MSRSPLTRSARALVGVSVALLVLAAPMITTAQTPEATPVAVTPDLILTAAAVTHYADLGVLAFEQTVEGTAGATVPAPAGQLDGAPVLAYVFPTTLPPLAV